LINTEKQQEGRKGNNLILYLFCTIRLLHDRSSYCSDYGPIIRLLCKWKNQRARWRRHC